MNLRSHDTLKRALAWLLIALMANPLPVVAQIVSNTPVRDTAIYLSTTAAGAVEPNILIVLGTNDRMNIAEPWREMPGAYDSHVEYLWADGNLILPNNYWQGLNWSNQTAQGELPGHPIAGGQTGGISLLAQPTNPVSPWGNWAGNTLDERWGLMIAAYSSMQQKALPSDPGNRMIYRNYGGGRDVPSTAPYFPRVWTGDPNWVWWAPAGTPEDSPLLWSVSFNKFAGGTRMVGGIRGGMRFVDANNNISNDDWRNRNQCQASYQAMMPSTVFAPSAYPRNAGKFLNQSWLRWEPFLDLDNSRVAAYPATEPATPWGGRLVTAQSGTGFNGYRIYPRIGYANSNTAAPALVMESGPDYWPWWAGPNNLFPAQNPGNGDRGYAGFGNGERWIFQSPGAYGAPIRMFVDNGTSGQVDPGDSRSGWSLPRADLGGYNYWWSGVGHLLEDAVLNSPWSSNANPLPFVMQQYGVAIAGTTQQRRFAALRGNRDVGGTDWWKVTGLPAYFSTSIDTGSITATSAQLTISRNNAFWPGQIINVPGAGPAGANLRARIDSVSGAGNRTLNLSVAATTSVTDAVITVNLNLLDRDPATVYCTRSCSDSEAAQPASNGQTDAWGRTLSFRSTSSTCVPGAVTESAAGACALSGTPSCGAPVSDDYYKTTARSGCYWTGRSSVFVEGVGTVTHGGTCMANCAERFPHIGTCSAGGTSATYCGAPSASNRTFNGVTYANAVINDGGNGSGSGCGAVNIPDRALNCTTREGTACQYQRRCNSPTWSATDSPPVTDFAVVNRARFAGYLVHDCMADNGTADNFNGFLNTRTDRRFGADWNTTRSDAANSSAAYSVTDPGTAVPAIDTYSANYLNWKFGPRGPKGHPIGRATRLETAKSALSDLVTNTNGVRFGLMVTNRTRADLTNDGGNIAYAMRRMGTDNLDPDFPNRAALASAINGVVASSRTPLTETLYEAMLYFAGRAPQWGTDAAPAYIGGVASQGRDTTAVCTGISADCPSIGVYRSPMLSNPTAAAPAGCQKNFVVMVTSGIPEDDWSANTLPGSRGVRNLAYNSTSPNPVGTFSPVQGVDSFNPATTSNQFENTLTAQPYGLLDQGSTAFDGGYLWLDELAYFMRNADMSPGARIFPGDSSTDLLTGSQGIITYTIGFKGATSPVVQQAAVRGDGLYYEAQDAQDLRNKLQQAITSITSFTGTLAAATVPISAYNRAQSALEVYMAFFEPSTSVSWRGTVRKYGIGTTVGECGNDTGGNPITFCLIGQTVLGSGNKNIEVSEQIGTTGVFERLISTLAVSYWNPLTEIDGRDPARGGTGYQLKASAPTVVPGSNNGAGTRNVYTKLSTVAATALTNSANAVSGANANITNGMLGVASTADRYRLLNWIRGGNMTVAQCNGTNWFQPCNQWSDWPHADVLHSKPAFVYYNTTTNPPEQVLFYLSNTGLLHAVDGNTGRERWAFMVEEALPQLGNMLANGNGEQLQIADGAPAVHVTDVNGNGIIEAGDKVIVTFGLRRGGRTQYALDVSNLAAPAFLWKATASGGGQLCTGACSSQPLYAELGQTWSTPVVGRVAGVANPVVMFGGGYDPNQDNEPVAVADTMGRAFFVVDLITGVPIRRFDSSNVLVSGAPAAAMPNSVAAEPTALDTNGDGLIDRVYIGDTAANVFRFQLSDLNPVNWSGKLIASLSTTAVPNRKILFPFAVVPQSAGGSRFDAIYLGTGDREHPFKLPTVDIIAMLIDRDYGSVMSSSPPILYTDTDFIKLAHDDTSGSAPVGGTSKGWARLLPPTAKVTEAPTVFQNLVLAPIYGSASAMGFPSLVSSCIPSFTSRIYGYAALDASITLLPGNSGSQAYIEGVWSRNFVPSGQLIMLPDGRVGFLFTNPTATFVQVAVVGVPQRVYWYLEPGI